jgi:hypothetical protein
MRSRIRIKIKIKIRRWLPKKVRCAHGDRTADKARAKVLWRVDDSHYEPERDAG